MLLQEPPRTPYDLNFSLLGIPVRVHPFFWVGTLLLGINANPKPLDMLLWILVVFVSIVVHEMGHALAARAHGFEPWITLHGFGGLASYPSSRRDPLGDFLITAAGPAAGLAFAGLVIGALIATGHNVQIDWRGGVMPVRFEPLSSLQGTIVVWDLLYVNIFWSLVNLLPVYPLDGGQIARIILTSLNPGQGLRQSLWLSVITGAVVAFLALTRLENTFLAIFFAYMAYTSYMALQNYFTGGYGGYR